MGGQEGVEESFYLPLWPQFDSSSLSAQQENNALEINSWTCHCLIWFGLQPIFFVVGPTIKVFTFAGYLVQYRLQKTTTVFFRLGIQDPKILVFSDLRESQYQYGIWIYIFFVILNFFNFTISYGDHFSQCSTTSSAQAPHFQHSCQYLSSTPPPFQKDWSGGPILWAPQKVPPSSIGFNKRRGNGV